MPTNRNVIDFKIHNLTEEQFQELKDAGQIDPNAIYCTPDITLKTNQITNCITEIPQDIKLEIITGDSVALYAWKLNNVIYYTKTAVANESNVDIYNANGTLRYNGTRNSIMNVNNEYIYADTPSDMPTGHMLRDSSSDIYAKGLALKANSKLYQPNGSGVFTPIVMSADKVRSDFPSFGSGTYLLFYSQSYGGLVARNIKNCVSGATDTSTATSHTWYDTTNNRIKTYENGSYTLDDLTLPLGVFENTYGTGATSIKNVFNGFGHIGLTVFVLPGVKGLVPNGRNDDGTLKNALKTTTNVSVYTVSTPANHKYQLAYNGTIAPFYSHMTYNAEENINYNANGTPSTWGIVGSVKFNNNTISKFTPKTTFHAVDSFDLVEKDYLQKSGGTMSGELVTTNQNAIRLTGTSYGAILRHDDESLWMLVTDEGNPLGEYNSLRPFRLNLKTGEITINGASAPAPAGMVSPFAGKTAPSGWLKCDGSAVSRTTYASLFAAIGTTYGAGNGSTTFNLPNLMGYVPLGMDGDYIGKTVNGALPNITGSVGAFQATSVGSACTGAFAYATYEGSAWGGGTHSEVTSGATFDASRSNSIYGDGGWFSGTRVIPASVGMTYCIKY